MSNHLNGDPAKGPPISAEEIDDILYFARVNEGSDLDEILATLSQNYSCPKTSILLHSIDPDSGNGPLHYAGANGHIELMTTMITHFASVETAAPAESDTTRTFVNQSNSAGNTPLHYAAINGQLSAVQLLLSHGGDVSILNQVGHDAIYEAELAGHEEVVQHLLKEADGLEAPVGGEEDGGGDDAAEASASRVGDALAGDENDDNEVTNEVAGMSLTQKDTTIG